MGRVFDAMKRHSGTDNNGNAAKPTAKPEHREDRKSTRLNSSHPSISYAVFCLKKKKTKTKSRRHLHTCNFCQSQPPTLIHSLSTLFRHYQHHPVTRYISTSWTDDFTTCQEHTT